VARVRPVLEIWGSARGKQRSAVENNLALTSQFNDVVSKTTILFGGRVTEVPIFEGKEPKIKPAKISAGFGMNYSVGSVGAP